MRADAIGVRLGDKTLLDEMSLDLEPGTVLAVAGPNGAGKSTLLDVLAGLRRPTTGVVTLRGRPIKAWDRRELAQTLAYLPQRDGLTASLQVGEVVALGRHPHRDEGRYDVRSCLAEVGMEALAGRSMDTLSGGERQRVHLARMLAQLDESRDQVLLLDEPTSALDVAQQHRVLSVVQGLAHRRGVAVLVVLHDLNLAGRFADRVLLLRAGRAVVAGPAAEVLSVDNLLHVFDVHAYVLAHPEHGRPQILVGRPADLGS